MNKSKENHVFVTTCRFAETSYVILNKFPNRNYELYQVTVLVINCLLIFSTISLNGISIITIRKSSQLRNKICYFVILLQSIVDLGVSVLSILLFIYYLLFPVLKTVNGSFDYMLHMNWSLTSMILNSSVNSAIVFWTKTLLRKEAFETVKSLCS